MNKRFTKLWDAATSGNRHSVYGQSPSMMDNIHDCGCVNLQIWRSKAGMAGIEGVEIILFRYADQTYRNKFELQTLGNLCYA